MSSIVGPNAQTPRPIPNWYHSFALRAGVLFVSEVAMLSFLSASGLLTVVVIRVYQRCKRKREGRSLPSDQPIQPVSLLFVLAMVMELVQATSNIMSARWAFEGGITEGPYCNAQASIKQIGDDGAALITMFLAIMTVTPMLWPKMLYGNRGRRIVYGMIGFMIVFGLLMVLLPSQVISNFYGSTGPWCWIPSKLANGQTDKLNSAMEIAAESGWFWLTSFTCFLCYGYVVIHWLREAGGDPEMARQALVMSWYPIAYFVEIFPQSLVRILILERQQTNRPPPHEGWVIFTSTLFASSGWVNVLLWALTGRQYGFSKDVYEEDYVYDQEGEGEGASEEYAMKPLDSESTVERRSHQSGSGSQRRSQSPHSITISSPTQLQSHAALRPAQSAWEDDPANALRLRRALSEVTAASSSSSSASAATRSVHRTRRKHARDQQIGSGRSRSLLEGSLPAFELGRTSGSIVAARDLPSGFENLAIGRGRTSTSIGPETRAHPSQSPVELHANAFPHLFP